MKKVLNALNQKRKSVVTVFTSVFMLALVTSAFAADPAADTATVSAITDGMSSIQATALAVVAAVAGVAVLLFAAPFAWQYGKKIFKTVAR